MGESTAAKCPARARHKKARYGEPHTFPCQREAGHDGAHEWKDPTEGRTVLWFGDAAPPDHTRMRFGRWLESK